MSEWPVRPADHQPVFEVRAASGVRRKRYDPEGVDPVSPRRHQAVHIREIRCPSPDECDDLLNQNNAPTDELYIIYINHVGEDEASAPESPNVHPPIEQPIAPQPKGLPWFHIPPDVIEYAADATGNL